MRGREGKREGERKKGMGKMRWSGWEGERDKTGKKKDEQELKKGFKVALK